MDKNTVSMIIAGLAMHALLTNDDAMRNFCFAFDGKKFSGVGDESLAAGDVARAAWRISDALVSEAELHEW